MSTIYSDPTHAAVREHYGNIARTQQSQDACCSTGCCDSLYPADQLTELPSSVTDLSLGCGDPVSLADLREGDTVLDLGSGGGIVCFLAAKRIGPAGHVIGVDMTPEMLERARANAVKLNAANVEFRAGHIEALPVEDGAVDVRATQPTDIVIDINGYFIDPALNAQSLAFYPLPPCRVYDSRNPNGPLGGPVLIPTDDSRIIPVRSSNCGVPANAPEPYGETAARWSQSMMRSTSRSSGWACASR